jgi:hypothetical protein
MEFRVIQKMTMHKDHAKNFFISSNQQFFKLNRHKDVLPFIHNRVVLHRSPFVEGTDEQNELPQDGPTEEKLL